MDVANELKKNYVKEVECPQELHHRIMSRYLFLRFRRNFFLMLSLTLANLFCTSWHLWGTMVQTRPSETAVQLVQNFTWRFDYFVNAVGQMHELVPFSVLISFLFGLALIFYTVRLFTAMRLYSAPDSTLFFLRKQKQN
jgi:hypothetical protein